MMFAARSTSECRLIGYTIWERCFWVENSGWVWGVVLFIVWWGPIVWYLRREGRRDWSWSTLPERFRPSLDTRASSTWLWLVMFSWLAFFGWFLGLILGVKVVEPLLLRLLGFE